MLRKLLFLLVVSLLTTSALLAQVTTSSISGIVKDQSGQNLAGASVTALHQPSGTRYATITQSGGNFTIANMRTGGPYQITISYVGMRTQTLNDIYLQLAEATVVNGNLESSEGTLQQVVVTGTGRRNNIMNANRTGAVTNISTREINRLPTISRSINDFTRITPQANGQSIGGGNNRQNFITVDGSDFNNTFGIGGNLPAGGNPISLDGVEEISVNIAPYDVRQANFIGSSINAVTRSGTNTINGSVYTYFRNENQRGNTVKGNDFTLQREDFWQWGVRVGGPIIKNKLFFFVNYETEKRTSPGQQRFAATASAPYGSAPNIARPTATELDAISQYLSSTYNYQTGPYQGYDFISDQTKILGRIDWNISDKHRLSARYSQVEGKTPSFVSGSTSSTGNTFQSGFGRTDINALHFQNSNYFQESNFYSAQLELNSRFSNRLSNIFRVSYNNQFEPRSTNSSLFPFVDILSGGQPFTSFGYEPFSLGNLRDVNIFTATNNLTYVTGKHNILGGVQVDMSKTRNGFQPLGMSYYRFNSFDDFRNGAKPTDFAITYSLNQDFSQAFPTFKFGQFAAYAQDEITFSRKFRLTLGLRADLNTYPDVDELKTNPLVASLTFQNGTKVNTGELPNPKVMLSPRIGFNYDHYGDRSLQIRGGTGIFTGRVPFVWIVGQSGNSGMLQVTQSFNGVANTPGPFNPDPLFYVRQLNPSGPPAAGTVIPSTVTAFDPNFTLPQTWKSSLGLDTRLPGGIIGTIDVIYNRDINVLYSKNINLVNPSPLGVAGYPDNRLIYPSNDASRYINPITTTGRPGAGANQQFNAIYSSNENQGHYFSTTLQLQKQFSSGFFGSIAYTNSIANNLYDGNGDQPFNTWSLIPSVNGANVPTLSYADYVVPHRLVATASYRKEFLKHLATTVSVFYQGSNQGRFSYVYGSDINRDRQTGNDLLYVPRDASEITFVDRAATASTPFVSAAEQSALFFKYIEQDDYLSKRKGMYAERNGALLPWRNQFDVKFVQDLFTNIKGTRNTLQFSVDIFNFANLLNSEWGVTQTTNTASLLEVTNVNSLTPGGTTRPTFRLALDRGKPVTQSYRDNLTTSSTYFMQFGLRYIFGN